jgi:hypothetical protein
MERSEAVLPLVAVLVVIATFFVLVLFGVIFTHLSFFLASIVGELLIVAIPLGYMLYKRIDVRKYIGLQYTPRAVLVGMAAGGLLLLFDIIVTVGLTAVLGNSALVEGSNELILEMSGSIHGLLQLIVALSLAGFCEEFTFRGFLQTSIENRYPFKAALFVSSLAFGLFHFDPQAVYTISAFLMGLGLGFVYNHWRSYTVSSVAHATVNLIALAFLLLPA